MLVYEAQWSTYEEWGAVEIYEDPAGNFTVRYGGYSVMAPHGEPDWQDLEPITLKEVIDLIDEWTAIEKEYENYFA